MPRVHGVLLEGDELLLVAKLARCGVRWVEAGPDHVPAPAAVRRLVRMLEEAAGAVDQGVGDEGVGDEDRPSRTVGSADLALIVGCSTKTITRRAVELGGWRVGRRPWVFDLDVALVRWSAIGHGSDTVVRRPASSAA